MELNKTVHGLFFEREYGSLQDILLKQKNIFTDMVTIAFSVVFMAAMANIQIPLWPVPITMQTFGIFTLAFFFGSRKGVVAVLAYILAGIAGLGVFASFKSGLGVITGATGGYIIGFIFCVFIVGRLIEKGYGRNWKSIFAIMVVGNIVIYACGLAGLKLFLGNIGLYELLMAGLIPFLVGDTLKILAAMALYPHLWKRG
jgi:biotin transport system substrate-specific component